jgi:chemotaxis protein histidine kinase CheA
MEDFKKMFIEDARKILADFRRDFSAIKQGENVVDALKNIQRYAHSLRGLSGMMELDAIQSLSAELEGRLGKIINGLTQINQDVLKEIEEGFNKIEAMLKNE